MDDEVSMEEILEYVQELHSMSQCFLEQFQQISDDLFTDKTIEVMMFWILQLKENDESMADYIETVQVNELSQQERATFEQIKECVAANKFIQESLESIFHQMRPSGNLKETLAISKLHMDAMLAEKMHEETEQTDAHHYYLS